MRSAVESTYSDGHMRHFMLVCLFGAATSSLSAQNQDIQPFYLDAVLGAGLSSSPSVWRGESGPLGLAGHARLSFPTGRVRFGVEWLQWLGRGEEILLDGFPPPDAPAEPPRVRSVWLSRSQLLLVVVLPLEAGPEIRVGTGLAILQGILLAQDCCLDAAGQWRETRDGWALALGMAFPRELSTNLRLTPGIDLSMQRVSGSMGAALSGTVGLSWRRSAR